MENTFQVAIHVGNSYGRIEYDPVSKTAKVILDNETKRKEVESFLNRPQTMLQAQKSLLDFRSVEINPLETLDSLKLALTKLWINTEVLVDWSRPVDDTFRVK